MQFGAVQGYWALHLLSTVCGDVVNLTRCLALDEAEEGVHRTLPPWMLWLPPVRCIGRFLLPHHPCDQCTLVGWCGK